jgi:uncharacterized membrane protein
MVTGTSVSRAHSTHISLVVNANGDFSISASPTSRTITAGGTAAYAATVAALNGFNETVTFGVSGLPAGATATFNPTSVTSSGTTDLTIVTAASTPAGTYQLTVTGTSVSRTHSSIISLVVNSSGSFVVAVSPQVRTIAKAGSTTYTVTVTSQGYTGTISFTASGLPRFATAKFTPPSLVDSGNSVLTVNTNKNVAPGSYTFTITATGGSIVRSTTATLTVQ